MTAVLTTIGIGLIVIVIGFVNMTGNISSLHWYHRKRVTEENKKPFGKLVGIGTVIIGVTLIFFGLFNFAFEKTQNNLFTILGIVVFAVGMVVGTSISFYAMIKYNKGIF